MGIFGIAKKGLGLLGKKKKKKDEETAQEMNSEIDSEYQQEFESSDTFDDFTL